MIQQFQNLSRKKMMDNLLLKRFLDGMKKEIHKLSKLIDGKEH